MKLGETKAAYLAVAVILTLMVGVLFVQARQKANNRAVAAEGANLIGVSTNYW